MSDADMKIVSMERTAAEKRSAQKRMEAVSADVGPDYPWGLCLNLGAEELDKLGISDLPAVGDEFHIYAVAKVTSVHQSQSSDGDDCRGVTLQITDMGTMSEGGEKEDDERSQRGFKRAAVKLYGKAEKAEGE